ncbi:OmpH family outer membrane protein [Magnetospirillum sulfuroxidans]|uniref:OmpH family outer membrane protein n=1 Tax=Magnetospirillum sulfuroxidans TaxID=611300 RepID=A0ABS5I883_9PROT|nr:OmpH family outer membrane protein [Magnetospirillum sulfuroxidans]MBR9970629.1 OmpH family outer membrane protein [Magnetospirillum sulfuroxidans]
MADFRAIRFAAGLVCMVLSSAALAENPPARSGANTPTVIVVVDANRIQRESLAGKAVVAERERYQQTFNNEFETARKQLQVSEKELAQQRTSLPAEVFQEKVRALNSRVAEFQRQYQGAVRALDKSSAAASNELQKAVVAVTSEVASEQGVGLVLHKQHVFLHDERMDITNTVIERLNKRLSSVPFPVPDVEKPSQPEGAPAKGKK